MATHYTQANGVLNVVIFEVLRIFVKVTYNYASIRNETFSTHGTAKALKIRVSADDIVILLHKLLRCSPQAHGFTHSS